MWGMMGIKGHKLAMVVALGVWGTGAQAAWLTVETKHVAMSGDLPEAEMRALCGNLEQLDALMTQVMGATTVPARRVVIRVFASNAEARSRTGLAKLQGGVTQSTPQGSEIIAAPRNGEPNALRFALFHEYAHAFRQTRLPGPRPLWFDEGFATFFESAEPLADGQMRFGPNPERLESVRRYGVTPTASILALDPASKDGPPPPDFYFTGWLIAHYMFAGGMRRKEIEDFVTAFAQGGNVGPLDGYFTGGTAAFDRDLLAEANAPGAFERTVAVTPATEISVRPMSDAELALTLFNLQLAGVVALDPSTDIYTVSDGWLDQLAMIGAKYPGDAEIARVAARIALRNGSVDRALPLVEAALAAHPEDAGLLAWRSIFGTIQADRGEVELFESRIAAARKLADRAMAIAPDDPDVLIAKARNMRAAEGDVPAVAGYLKRAVAADPGNSDVRGDLAQVYDRLGDKKSAIAVMLSVAESDSNPVVRRRARRTISALRAGYPYQ
jgi:hypothetical protein